MYKDFIGLKVVLKMSKVLESGFLYTPKRRRIIPSNPAVTYVRVRFKSKYLVLIRQSFHLHRKYEERASRVCQDLTF